jgi:Ca-activated chloride channel family protein
LKNLIAYIFFLFFIPCANAQYYLRGEIKDEKSQPLQNVKIMLHSTRYIYYTGYSGGFGITCNNPVDSITLILDGYEVKSFSVKTDVFQQITLKSLSANTSKSRQKLISISRDQDFSSSYNWYVSDESYFSLVENEVVNAAKFPNTGFSLNINKASYSNIRRFLNNESQVPPDAVRIEELLNYFNLHYREPKENEVFGIESQLSDCPWNADKKLLFLNVNARKLDMDNVPPSNLVFLIDVSGSMDMPNRLPLVKAAFQMLIKNLRAKDTVSIVAYGGAVSVWMQPTSGAEKQKIIQSIEELTAAGDTPGASAIRMAYDLAKHTFIKGGNNRVILATDGDFNVGEVSEKALEELITKKKKTGVYLTCLGVGMGNYKDSKLEILAKRGNGNYAYLDDISEAEKVLVKEVTQTFYSVADDVFLNIHFNPEVVKNYRLIGFDNKRDAVADSTGELEGGDIGSGNSVLAIFEITPFREDDIIKGSTHQSPASVSLKYTVPKTTGRKELNYTCPANYQPFDNIDKEFQLGTAIAMFGMRLKFSKFFPSTDWTDIETIANNAYNPSSYLQKQFVELLSTAKKIYGKKKKKK